MSKRSGIELTIIESCIDWLKPTYKIREFDYDKIFGFSVCPCVFVPEYWTNFFWYRGEFCSNKGDMIGSFLSPTATWIEWYGRTPEIFVKFEIANPDLLDRILAEIKKRY